MYRLLLLAPIVVSLILLADSSRNARGSDDNRREPDVVYVGSPHDVVAKMLDMVQLKKEDVVYDLGCGDGRIVVAAAKKYGCHGVGFDLNPVRVEEARVNARKNVYITGTMLSGRYALRICVLSFRTHRDRMEQCLADIRGCVGELSRQ